MFGYFNGGLGDAFLAKFSEQGNALVYSTYLGGSTDDEYGYGIAVDQAGSAYVTGYTWSSDFPTHDAFDDSLSGLADGFVTKVHFTGLWLDYSTYLGGWSKDFPLDIAVDPSGCAYVTGWTRSDDFPVKGPIIGALQGLYDLFVTKLSPVGNSLVYSTFIGGVNNDYGERIALDAAGCAYVCGFTFSTDFPVLNAYDDTYYGNGDAVVTKLSPGGDALVYSTYLGGEAGDYARGIDVNNSGCAYVTGETSSSDFPTRNAFDSSHNGGTDAFVVKLSDRGDELVFGTYLGGTLNDYSYGISAENSGDSLEELYLVGCTASSDFLLQNSNCGSLGGDFDAFVTKILLEIDNPVEVETDGSDRRLQCGIELDQNFPNPFNPVTMIDFSIPSRTFVTIEIYNVLGQEVRTLLAGMRNAGKHRTAWDGNDQTGKPVSTGVYLYRIRAGEVVLTRKMMVLR